MKKIVMIIIIVLILIGGILSYFQLSRPSSKNGVQPMENLKLSSPAFQENTEIPGKYTCKGENINPALNITGIPKGTKTLALIVDDPDAPRGTWVHWVVWNIPAETKTITEDNVPSGARQGLNNFNRQEYGGPCPPSGTHRYMFKLYALDAALVLKENSKKEDVEKAMQGHLLAQARLMGLYTRR